MLRKILQKTIKSSMLQNETSEIKSISKLIRVMRQDPLINKKVIKMLNMKSYQRRSVLNNWLEQLRRKNAPEHLKQALSCLFDDRNAHDILTLINNKLT